MTVDDLVRRVSICVCHLEITVKHNEVFGLFKGGKNRILVTNIGDYYRRTENQPSSMRTKEPPLNFMNTGRRIRLSCICVT